MADDKRTATYNSKGQVIGYSNEGRKATDVVSSDKELETKIEEQREARAAASKPKQGLGALAAALRKATPTPSPKK